MCFRSSFATLVAVAGAALMFSVALPTANGSILVIDQFTQSGTAASFGGSTVNTVTGSITVSGTFGVFDRRGQEVLYAQAASRGFRVADAISTGTGSGALRLINTGLGNGLTIPGDANSYFTYFSGDGSSKDLTGQQSTGFRVETLVTFASPPGSFVGYMQVTTGGFANSAEVLFPSMWDANTGIEIPFSSFPGLDFTQVDVVTIGIKNPATLAGSMTYNAFAEFASISVVPEPSQLVLVASVGATLGAWRLRKLRRVKSEKVTATKSG